MINLKLKANQLSNILMLLCITTRQKQIKLQVLLKSWSVVFGTIKTNSDITQI